MNRLLLLLSLGVSAMASASVDRFYRLYEVDPAPIDRRTKEAIAKLDRNCSYSEFSRLGPRPSQVAACDRAERSLVALGGAGARAALAAIDDEKTDPTTRVRLYDAIARIGDLSLVEPLIRGLEREEAAGLGNPRHYERSRITGTLTALTYADLKGTPALQWRAWLNGHPNPSREALLAERTAEVEAQLNSPDVDQVVSGARFLGSQPAMRERARHFYETLLTRSELSPGRRRLLRRELDSLAPAPSAAPTTPTAAAQLGTPRS